MACQKNFIAAATTSTHTHSRTYCTYTQCDFDSDTDTNTIKSFDCCSFCCCCFFPEFSQFRCCFSLTHLYLLFFLSFVSQPKRSLFFCCILYGYQACLPACVYICISNYGTLSVCAVAFSTNKLFWMRSIHVFFILFWLLTGYRHNTCKHIQIDWNNCQKLWNSSRYDLFTLWVGMIGQKRQDIWKNAQIMGIGIGIH